MKRRTEAVTLAGAEAEGLAERSAALEEGKDADLVSWMVSRSNWQTSSRKS